MYTPEEIQEIFDRYNASIRAGIPVSEALAREMADAVKGVKNYTATLNNSLKQLGQASKQAAVDITNGAKGTSVFNSSIESAGTVVSTVASQFGVLGKGIGLVVNALTGLFVAINKQSDALYGSFQQLSRTGTVGAQGMDDVFQNMQRFGYTINELDKMGSVLAENSKNFSAFSGTAATGAKDLANMVYQLEDSRVKFFNLGLTVDDIVKGGAGYARQLGALGRAQQVTAEGAKAYIREQELLTRLTGLQRKELEDARQAAEDIDQFYAALLEMDPEAAKNADRVFKQLYALDPKKARAFALSMDGIISGSEDQMQAIMSTNGQFLDLSMGIKQGRITFDQFMQGYSDATRTNIDLQKDLAKIGVTDFMGGLKSNVILANKGLDPFARQLGKAQQEVSDLESGVNAATDAQSKTRDSQIKISNSIQDLINIGVNPLTKAFQILTSAVEYLTQLIPFSGRARARYEQEQQERVSDAVAKTTGGIIDKIIQVESGGRNIGNVGGTSTAFGIGQMTKGTFEGLAKQASPGSALYGKTFEDMKADVGLQRQALAQLTTQNQAALSKAGVAVTDSATYLAHFLGPTGALRVLQAPDQTPVESVVDGRAIHANANVFKNLRTAGDLKAWAERKMGTSNAAATSAPARSQQQSGVPNPGDLRNPNQAAQTASGAFGFQGTISGPMSGYKPNILMHGTEEISIRPSNANTINDLGPNSAELFAKMVEKLDEMIYLSRNQLGVNEKMLKYQQ